MRSYFIRRLLIMIPLLIGVTVIIFILMNVTPGDPVMMFIDLEKGPPDPVEMERVRVMLGLDQPLPVRYVKWLGSLLRGDLGYSYFSRQPVMFEIQSRIGTTVLLSVLSMGVSFFLGMLIGVICALNQYRVTDYILSVLAFIGLSMPSFWLAMMMILLFTNTLKWLPSVGLSDVTMVDPTFFQALWDRIRHLIMPVFAMSVSSIGSWARYQRASFLEVVNQDYIRTARSKGLGETVIVVRHALRNSALPIITMLGGAIPGLIGGSVLIENIFGLPGMGRLFFTSISQSDYPVIMGITFFSAILVMLGTFLSDILYAVVDPRIRFN